MVGTPNYLASHGTSERLEDLLKHECTTFRSPTNGARYAWELGRGRKEWRLPVRGGVVTNDGLACAAHAKLGLGLACAPGLKIRAALDAGQLRILLEPFAASVQGYFIYFPVRAQVSKLLRRFLEAAKEILRRKLAGH